MMLYVYVFAHNYIAAKREHQLSPADLATVIHQVPVLGLGLAPTVNSPGSGLFDVPFFASTKSTWTSLKPW
jgi:hypothetical protein